MVVRDEEMEDRTVDLSDPASELDESDMEE